MRVRYINNSDLLDRGNLGLCTELPYQEGAAFLVFFSNSFVAHVVGEGFARELLLVVSAG